MVSDGNLATANIPGRYWQQMCHFDKLTDKEFKTASSDCIHSLNSYSVLMCVCHSLELQKFFLKDYILHSSQSTALLSRLANLNAVFYF